MEQISSFIVCLLYYTCYLCASGFRHRAVSTEQPEWPSDSAGDSNRRRGHGPHQEIGINQTISTTQNLLNWVQEVPGVHSLAELDHLQFKEQAENTSAFNPIRAFATFLLASSYATAFRPGQLTTPVRPLSQGAAFRPPRPLYLSQSGSNYASAFGPADKRLGRRFPVMHAEIDSNSNDTKGVQRQQGVAAGATGAQELQQEIVDSISQVMGQNGPDALTKRGDLNGATEYEGPGTLIVDTDMGPDDIAAIALLAFHQAPVRLVTTVHGVCGDGLSAEIARRMISALSPQDVEVVPGASKPLSGKEFPLEAWRIERRDQLAAFNSRAKLPADPGPVQEPSADAAADAILRVACDSERPAIILALGPLSNVARAAERDPANFSKGVGLVVVAGDSSRPGSIFFNGRLDLKAVETLLRSRVPVVFVGARSRMRGSNFYTQLGSYDLGNSTAAYLISEMSTLRPDCVIDDPTAAAYVLLPSMFECERVDVLCNATAGQFLRVNADDVSDNGGSRSVVLSAKSVKEDSFVQLLRSVLESLDSYPQPS